METGQSQADYASGGEGHTIKVYANRAVLGASKRVLLCEEEARKSQISNRLPEDSLAKGDNQIDWIALTVRG